MLSGMSEMKWMERRRSFTSAKPRPYQSDSDKDHIQTSRRGEHCPERHRRLVQALTSPSLQVSIIHHPPPAPNSHTHALIHSLISTSTIHLSPTPCPCPEQ